MATRPCLKQAALHQQSARLPWLGGLPFCALGHRSLLVAALGRDMLLANEACNPEDRDVLFRMYVRRELVFWHEEIVKPIG